MGSKYSSNSTSGYNSTPPDDNGTVSEANKIKYSTVKTKLADPVKDLADLINTELVTHFDVGPTAITTNTTLGATHYNQIIQVSGSSVTLTLTDASTLGAGWYCRIINIDASNTITIARATGGDTINGSAADITLGILSTIDVFVIAAATGFRAITFVTLDNTETLTNKTLTAPVLSGSATGTYTLAGTPTITSPTITGATIDVASGVAFPATQSASADANTLDDYEEGTWTPVITFDTAGDLSVAYSVQSGNYTKIGRMVLIEFLISTTTFTHTTASGNLRLTGLSFTPVMGGGVPGALTWRGITKASYTQVSIYTVSSQTYFNFYASGSGQAISAITTSDMPTGGTINLLGTLAFSV